MGNNISENLGFRAALNQFGHAAVSLAWATGKAPFTGGWKRLVLIGPPVLLLASGVGALIYTIMTKAIREIGRMFYQKASTVYNDFLASRHVAPVRPDPQQPRDLPARVDSLIQRQVPVVASRASEVSSAAITLAPLPIDAAKERNQSLLKLLGLVEKLVIDPLVQKKDLVLGREYTHEGLKKWLMCMTLWRLGLMWDQLENQYVQMKTPPPPTVQSIVTAAKKIDASLGEMFEQAPTAEILAAILGSPLSDKIPIATLCFKLDAIRNQPIVGEETKFAEQQEIRKQFALIMNNGMANTLSHMSAIVEGWITVMNIPPVALPQVAIGARVEESQPNPFTSLVRDVSHQVQKDLTANYLMPLWSIKFAEWNGAVREDLGRLGTNTDLFEQFMDGKIDEKQFLENVQSHVLPTSLTSMVCFMRAVRLMGRDESAFSSATQSIVASVLAQLQPTLTDTLSKSTEALSQISFERTVPKFVDYFIELLNCSKTMQEVRQPGLDSNFEFMPGRDPLILALRKVGAEGVDFDKMERLHKETRSQISGKEIITKFPEGSIHKAVRRSLDSPLHEEEWIRLKKEEIKTILQLRAQKYAQEEGTLLSSLLKARPAPESTNVVSAVLSLSNKLRNVPAVESVLSFLFSGVESMVVNKGVRAIQSSINEVTSTGYLGAAIATTVVKGLIYKEDEKWDENLSVLQQAYLFLQPEEQAQVLKHLEAVCTNSTLERRKAQLEKSSFTSSDLQSQIEEMKRKESAYVGAVNQLVDVLKKVDSVANPEEVAQIVDACEKLKREKELQQFYRARTLVTYVADSYLTQVLTMAGGAALKSICIRVIHEALTLLTCQELVKHWIFTIVDLVIDELKESSNGKPAAHQHHSEERKSLLDFIPEAHKQRLLGSLTDFMQAAEKDKSWTSLSSWITWGAAKVSNWSPGTIWGYIEPYKEKATITPVELKGHVVKWVDTFGRGGLSELIIQALTEHVADPRPHKK